MFAAVERERDCDSNLLDTRKNEKIILDSFSVNGRSACCLGGAGV